MQTQYSPPELAVLKLIQPWVNWAFKVKINNTEIRVQSQFNLTESDTYLF